MIKRKANIFILIIASAMLSSCFERDEYFTHLMHGPFDILKIEQYHIDTAGIDWVYDTVYRNPGSLILYDNELPTFNECYYDIHDSALCFAIEDVEANTSANGQCFWYSDEKNRFTLWNPGAISDFYAVMYKEKTAKNEFTLTYILAGRMEHIFIKGGGYNNPPIRNVVLSNPKLIRRPISKSRR